MLPCLPAAWHPRAAQHLLARAFPCDGLAAKLARVVVQMFQNVGSFQPLSNTTVGLVGSFGSFGSGSWSGGSVRVWVAAPEPVHGNGPLLGS